MKTSIPTKLEHQVYNAWQMLKGLSLFVPVAAVIYVLTQIF